MEAFLPLNQFRKFSYKWNCISVLCFFALQLYKHYWLFFKDLYNVSVVTNLPSLHLGGLCYYGQVLIDPWGSFAICHSDLFKL